MAKKKQKQQRQAAPKQNDDKVSLGDFLNKDIVAKLKETQKELKEVEQRKAEAELEKQKEERRLREKNKSFEELLNESNLKWNEYK
ncbi:YqkE family protein [Bacillus luteolus]|uniref:YqkE family protein n=1 Tax=Litchfieldia luteola TaxID=682179 RepID=A0ABR9QPE9_9BACI|nr:YqkE family protein [Cytobacillus luteolus]MBE4910380.1 YqkE family protein [Cytobacillus luteolus]MBP1942045.1 Skp family chaperone for outer membrane proteins [Cytobacillus luteolus]